MAQHNQPRVKRAWPIYTTIIVGALIAITGWALTHTTLLLAWQLGDANTEANLCASSLGIVAQAQNATTRQHCQLASTAQTISAIMMAIGILVLVAGGVWLWRRMRRVSAPVPSRHTYDNHTTPSDWTTHIPAVPKND
jgi:LPXTG-motif cell wall-anchored protein